MYCIGHLTKVDECHTTHTIVKRDFSLTEESSIPRDHDELYPLFEREPFILVMRTLLFPELTDTELSLDPIEEVEEEVNGRMLLREFHRDVLFSLFESFIPLFFLSRPVGKRMLRKRIIRDFFEFGCLLSDPGRDLEFFVFFFYLYISEDDTFIGSLIFVEFPELPIGMPIRVTNLRDFCMSDHDIEGYSIWDFPLIFITDVWTIFFTFYINLKSKSCAFFSRLEIFDQTNTEFITITLMDG